MIVLREYAPAKINLYLHVTGKRPDDYHLLDSLVVFADAGDTLEVRASARLELSLEGPQARMLSATDNSVLKAAEIVRNYGNVTYGARLTLHKHLPVASGIGGGSADAAAALRLLARFWKLSIPKDKLSHMALQLGADVPACLHSSSLYMEGIGEKITPGPTMPPLHLVLINPGVPLATPAVFKAFSGSFIPAGRHPAAFASLKATVEFLLKTRNDLELAAIKQVPEIGTVLQSLAMQPKCLLSRMSGSGATCFGIFEDGASAASAATMLAAQYPEGWVRTAKTLGGSEAS